MNCNSIIHDELKAMGNSICDFCDVKLVDDILKQEDPCCEKIDLIKDDGMNVCKNCGVVNGYDLQDPYIDFHDNKYKMSRKSVYIRKYHILNVINDIAQKNNIQISNNNNREKIRRIFALIDTELSQVNGNCKRMISVTYVLRKLLKMLGLSYKNIPLSKSKKTLIFYEQWWKRVYELTKDNINKIIER